MTGRIAEVRKIKEGNILKDFEKYGEEFFLLKRDGTSRRTISYTDEQKEFIKNTYAQEHEDAVSVGKRFNIPNSTVLSFLRKEGCNIKSVSDVARKHPIGNERAFQTIDTEEKAYWLGMIYADGYIAYKKKTKEHLDSRLVLSLQKADEEHIYKFRKFLGYETHKPREQWKSNPQGSKSLQVELTVISTTLVEDLINKGMVATHTLPEGLTRKEVMGFPTDDQVPPNLFHHFIRGYFDGDGTIGFRNLENKERFPYELGFSAGNKSFGEALREYFRNNGVYHKEGSSYVIKASNTDKLYSYRRKSETEVRKMIEIMYKDSTVSLDRKLERIKQAKTF